MRGKHTIVMNGKVYDTVTGLPVALPPQHHSNTTGAHAAPAQKKPSSSLISDFGIAPTNRAKRPAAKTADQHHAITKRSTTLRRDIVKKPATKGHHQSHAHVRQPGHIARSPMISHFAPHPQTTQKPVITEQPLKKTVPAADIRPIKHPVQKAAESRQPIIQNEKKTSLSAAEKKQALVSTQLQNAIPNTKKPRGSKLFFRRVPTIVASCFAIILLGGYLTYLNMPSISVRVAASQAGINASLPSYTPDGYRFSGPVSFAPGQVTVSYRANGGSQWFNINQQSSSWDSQAVLDNLVAKESESYLTYSEQGMTIYTYDNRAAWVNGGVLYTIEGEAPLSNDQVLKIAGSM